MAVGDVGRLHGYDGITLIVDDTHGAHGTLIERARAAVAGLDHVMPVTSEEFEMIKAAAAAPVYLSASTSDLFGRSA